DLPGVPSIGFGDGTAGFGSYNGYPQFFIEIIYTYSDMVSITKGRHNLKIGGDLRRNMENSEFNVARPSYYFFDQLFFAADAPAEIVAGVDPGIETSRPAELSTNIRAWRNWEVGAFIQDDWKISRNLVLNLGLRYDNYRRHTEKYGKETTFIPGATPAAFDPTNPLTHSMVQQILNANTGCPDPLAQLAGVCGPGGFAKIADAGVSALGGADNNNFGPRIGVAWDPRGDGKMAIRGGFGISYEGTLYNPLSNSRWNLPFYSFNIADNDLFGDVSCVIYGPTSSTLRGGPNNCLLPSGATATYTGAGTNPGAGAGAQATGNIVGWDPTTSNLAFLTGIVFPRGIIDPWIINPGFTTDTKV
ncbi:MAG: TonB-dependent receptor, partial [Chloroflexota bacterium]